MNEELGKMVLQFIYHIGFFTKMLENKLRSHRHYAFYPHESLKSGIQIFLAIAISLYKEDNECTVFASNRKKLWNEPFDSGSPHGDPRSPLLCHPCYRLWPAEPLTWQDLIWGLPPTVCLSCNKVSKPQGLLHIGFLSLTFLQAPQIPLWRSPQAPASQTCEVPWVCPYVATKVTWEVKMVAAVCCLGLWGQAALANLPVASHWLLDFSQLFGVGLTVDSMRRSRAWALESERTWKPGFAMCRYDLGKTLSSGGPRVSHPVFSAVLMMWGCGDGRR